MVLSEIGIARVLPIAGFALGCPLSNVVVIPCVFLSMGTAICNLSTQGVHNHVHRQLFNIAAAVILQTLYFRAQ